MSNQSLAQLIKESELIVESAYDFRGGVKLPGHKAMSLQRSQDLANNNSLIRTAPIPKRLAIPLSMHIGATAEPTVKVGERVLKGQRIAKPDGYISAPVHASSSGTVVAIHDHPVPHPSGLTAPCVIIETDGLDEAVPVQYVEDYKIMDTSHLRNVVRQAGIVGLGGAAFPTNVKMTPSRDKRVDTLILNGAECEPYITCDEALMQERAAQIVAGIDIIQCALQAKQVMIGIGDEMFAEADALAAALSKAGRTDTTVVMVPTRYPKGGEKQLIQSLTGKEVPSNGLPIDIGIVCQNVGTAAAIYKAVCLGEPLISRVITVTGPGINNPQNVEARIGTPVRDLIEFAGGYSDNIERLIMGGPMMGYALHNDQVPVVKSTNCILGAAKSDLPDYSAEMPCIRCGSCADVCPASLLPQQLYWHSKAKEFDRTLEYDLFDCIECGCCSAVCPSHIPLVQYYRFAKGEIWKQEAEKTKSDRARERHEFRQARFEREAAEKAARLAEKKAALKKPKQPKPNQQAQNQQDPAIDTEKTKPVANDAIAAAIARAKAKKNQTTSDTATSNDAKSPSTASSVNPALAAIEKAKLAKQQATGSDQAGATTTAPDDAESGNAKPSDKELGNAAAAAIAKAKAAAKQQPPESSISKITSQAAPQATEHEKADTETTDKAALAKAAIERAKNKRATAAGPTEQPPKNETKLSPAQLAIAKAKAKAKTTAADTLTNTPTDTPKQDKKTAGSDTGSDAGNNTQPSAAQLAIQKARAQAQVKAQQDNQQKSSSVEDQPALQNKSADANKTTSLSPAQAAIARAKAQAKNKAKTQAQNKAQTQAAANNQSSTGDDA